MLMDAYSSFITHYIDSKEALRQAQTRPQFVRFMDNVLKDHREKYTIAELMITPVQRIPRYQLLLNVSSFFNHGNFFDGTHPCSTYAKFSE